MKYSSPGAGCIDLEDKVSFGRIPSAPGWCRCGSPERPFWSVRCRPRRSVEPSGGVRPPLSLLGSWRGSARPPWRLRAAGSASWRQVGTVKKDRRHFIDHFISLLLNILSLILSQVCVKIKMSQLLTCFKKGDRIAARRWCM